MSKLRPRERELVRYMMQGIDSKEAALKMGISPGTTKNYLCRARGRLGARNTAQMFYKLGMRGER